MLFGGGIGGGPFGSGTASEANRAAGLPFAGIPPELSQSVEKLLPRSRRLKSRKSISAIE